MRVIAFSVFLTVTAAAVAYVSVRLVRPMPWSPGWKVAAGLVTGSMLVVPFTSILLTRYAEDASNRLAWPTGVMLALFSFTITLVAARDLVLVFGKVAGRVAAAVSGTSDTPRDPARRAFLTRATNAAAVAAAGLLTSYGVFQARRRPQIVRVTVPIKGLPAAFDGFRIVQITDLHVGLTVTRDWVEVVASEVNALRPDLVAVTGDLTDGSVAYLRDHVAPLAEIRAPYGKYFVTGNHDYFFDAEGWVAEVERLGYRALLNAHAVVEKDGAAVVVAGVTDLTGGQHLPHHRSDPRRAVAGAPVGPPKILLAHQPLSFAAAEPLGFDLVLMGHTHGGQFFPWNLVTAAVQPFLRGLYRRGGTWIYVSSGTGYWGPPVRVGTRSEITVLTLTRESGAE
ncbi:metallophosphoesterase [Gemmata sp.]|uniref:metallophosphoesterase n=1 Tax=Gemmata sp. TaxID=1914242 RepID=UPI003F7037E0